MYSSICNLLHKYNFDEDGSFYQKHKTLIDHACRRTVFKKICFCRNSITSLVQF